MVKTHFCDKQVPPENVKCSYVAAIVLDLVCKFKKTIIHKYL